MVHLRGIPALQHPEGKKLPLKGNLEVECSTPVQKWRLERIPGVTVCITGWEKKQKYMHTSHCACMLERLLTGSTS